MQHFTKNPLIIYNNIELQSKTNVNSLSIQEWNRIVNALSQQANVNTDYLTALNRLLFGEYDENGYLRFDLKGVEGLLPYLFARKADLDTHGLIYPSQVPGFAYSVEEVTTFNASLHNNPNVIYVHEGKQYRWYAQGKWIELVPFITPTEFIEQILEEGFVIDCGEYGNDL